MALKIDSLEITITSQANSASAAVDNLTASLKELKKQAKGVGQVAQQIEQVKEKAEKASGKSKGELFMSLLGKKAGGFFKSIGRIALYRGIRTALKALTNAVKEGTTNLYQYSKLLGGSFSKSLDNVSTSLLYLKNGLAVGLAPVIEWLTPLIVTVADAFAEMGNAVSEVVAKGKGEDYFTRAKKTFKEFAEAANKAKSAVLGFDELNVIQKDTNYEDMFEQVEVNTERAESNLSKIETAISQIAGIGIGTGALKVLADLSKAGVVEIGIGDILLKASGIGLSVAGSLNMFQILKDAFKNGDISLDDSSTLAWSILETGAGFSLLLKSPIPILISAAIAFAAAENPMKVGIYELTGIDLEALDAELNRWGHNTAVGFTNIFKDIINGLYNAIAEPFNMLIDVVNGVIDVHNFFDPNNKWEYVEYIHPYQEEFDDLMTYEQGQATYGNPDLYSNTGITANSPIINSINRLVELANAIASDVGNTSTKSHEDINIYIDGKQIIGAARKAERQVGKQVSAGILYE